MPLMFAEPFNGGGAAEVLSAEKLCRTGRYRQAKASSARRFLNLRNAQRGLRSLCWEVPRVALCGDGSLRFRHVWFVVSSRRIITNRAVALPKRTSLPAGSYFQMIIFVVGNLEVSEVAAFVINNHASRGRNITSGGKGFQLLIAFAYDLGDMFPLRISTKTPVPICWSVRTMALKAFVR